MLKKIHGSNRHLGKAPARLSESAPAAKETATVVKTAPTLQDLKEELYQAIQDEDFERAAQLRDKIREMERHNT